MHKNKNNDNVGPLIKNVFSMSTIENLPMELLDRIVQYLPASDAINFTSTSRQMNDLTRFKSFWKNLMNNDLPQSVYLREMSFPSSDTIEDWRHRFITARNISFELEFSIKQSCVRMIRQYYMSFPYDMLLENMNEQGLWKMDRLVRQLRDILFLIIPL